MISTLYIDELASCDVLIIGAPMINHSVSSGLKTWIDQVCQAGLTFRFTSAGAVGLLTDKPTFIVSTRGGIYCAMKHIWRWIIRKVICKPR